MKLPKSIFFFFFFYAGVCFSQRETEKWYYAGSPAPAIDFSSGVPVALNNSGITFSWESGTSLADANGNLLFYADGNAVCFNRNHVAMPNGTGLYMHNSVTQGCIFVPKPGNPNIYYLFHIGAPNLGSGPPFNLYYSEIDITLNGGLGNITANKNISIATSFGNCAEKMTVTKHCNGTDYWLMVHSYTGNTFRAYLINSGGVVVFPIVSNIGANYLTQVPSVNEDAVGQMKFSPNGNKLAVMVAGQKIVELFDFNKNTGALTNHVNLGAAGSDFPYGLEFSHDNTKVYSCGASNFGNPSLLKQWDLCAGDNNVIIASGTTIANNVSCQSLQMAPDGKIYGCKSGNFLLTINNPNVAGLGCNFVSNGFNTSPGSNQLGLPNFITSYFDKPSTYSNAVGTSVNATNCQSNGSASVTLCSSFGVGPFTYTWSNNTVVGPTPNTTSSIQNLSGGSYSVIITDAACARDTVYFTIQSGGSLPPVVQNITKCNSYTRPGGAVATVSGTYNDTILSSGGCDSIITTNLTILSNSSSAITQSICSNQTYTLPDGTIVNSAGTYTSTITSFNGCDSIITTTLNVNPSPIAGVSPNVTITTGITTTLTATGGGTYNWYPTNNLDSTNTAIVNATPNQTTIYCVEITSSNGCKDTACVTVSVELPCPKETDLKVPNAFSPNNDGVNDEFCLQGWNDCVEDFEILIYDRWGAKVYESKDSGFCWEGKYNGTILDAAVFVYQIKARFLNIDHLILKKGNITLIR